MSKNNSPVGKGKKKREELSLPHLTYVVCDDWIEKLGYETFCLWLKLHTWVDRNDEEREYDRIPRSFENIYKKTLGISKSKFYRLIKPLWEFGLIDIVEYVESERNSTKPKNIIVYEYPFHEIVRKYQALEKLRDWDQDYDSVSKELGKTGGRPRKAEAVVPEKKGFKLVKSYKKYRFKIKTVEGFNFETVEGFKNKTVEGFKNETVTVSKLKPNNVSNISINVSNPFNNESNSFINLSINKSSLNNILKDTLLDRIDRLIKFNIKFSDIENHFNAVKDIYWVSEYNYVLACYLDKNTVIPDSFGAVMNNWLLRNREKFNNIPSKQNRNVKPVRRELLPDWFDENEYNKKDIESLPDQHDIQKQKDNSKTKKYEEMTLSELEEQKSQAESFLSRFPTNKSFQQNLKTINDLIEVKTRELEAAKAKTKELLAQVQ